MVTAIARAMMMSNFFTVTFPPPPPVQGTFSQREERWRKKETVRVDIKSTSSVPIELNQYKHLCAISV